MHEVVYSCPSLLFVSCGGLSAWLYVRRELIKDANIWLEGIRDPLLGLSIGFAAAALAQLDFSMNDFVPEPLATVVRKATELPAWVWGIVFLISALLRHRWRALRFVNATNRSLSILKKATMTASLLSHVAMTVAVFSIVASPLLVPEMHGAYEREYQQVSNEKASAMARLDGYRLILDARAYLDPMELDLVPTSKNDATSENDARDLARFFSSGLDRSMESRQKLLLEVQVNHYVTGLTNHVNVDDLGNAAEEIARSQGSQLSDAIVPFDAKSLNDASNEVAAQLSERDATERELAKGESDGQTAITYSTVAWMSERLQGALKAVGYQIPDLPDKQFVDTCAEYIATLIEPRLEQLVTKVLIRINQWKAAHHDEEKALDTMALVKKANATPHPPQPDPPLPTSPSQSSRPLWGREIDPLKDPILFGNQPDSPDVTASTTDRISIRVVPDNLRALIDQRIHDASSPEKGDRVP